MSIGNGHQAVESAPFAEVAGFNSETGEVELTNIESFQADCVNPPDGVASTEWIADGFPGATSP